MKSSQIAIISGLIASVLASPVVEGLRLRTDADVRFEDVGKMTFVGQAFVDGPNVTLVGDAQSIFAQLLAINPHYDAWEFPDYQERMAAKNITREDDMALTHWGRTHREQTSSLHKRDAFVCHVAGNEVGNVYTQCPEPIRTLERMNGWCQVGPGHGNCVRFSCANNCGIWLCNDNSYTIQVWCGNLAGDAWDIIGECGYEYNEWVMSAKGQVFRDGPPPWNTVLRSEGC